jgi:hypothetical protein
MSSQLGCRGCAGIHAIDGALHCRRAGGFRYVGESMRIVWIIVGALVGLVIGAVLGFGAALIAMSASKSHNDGSYGMREMIVCLPSGAVLGLVAGVLWGLTTSLAGG